VNDASGTLADQAGQPIMYMTDKLPISNELGMTERG